MRVLWITNNPVAEHRNMLGLPLNEGGGWLEVAYASLKEHDDTTLAVATIYSGKEIKRGVDGNHHFYLLPCEGDIARDISDNPVNQQYWKTVIEEFKPEIIQLWGTEFSHGLCALKVASDIPSVAYMQGLMNQIANHYLAQISLLDQIKSTTLRDLYLKQCFWHQEEKQKRRALIEQEILKRVKAVIVENRWCAYNCRLINNDVKVFKSLLPINPVFSEYDWNIERINPHTIFTVAGNYPHKGFHMLLMALSLVVQRYPDVKVLVPGTVTRSNRRGSYFKYTSSIIEKYGLSEHIEYLGRLAPKEMALQMASCNAFVMPSSIENHSSTLIEAMMVGAPCIASNVGGVSDYLKNGENGLLYRFEEYQTLAAQIMDIFENEGLALQLSVNAMTTTRNDRLSIDLKADLLSSYKMIIK